jgi:hypothetical protein
MRAGLRRIRPPRWPIAGVFGERLPFGLQHRAQPGTRPGRPTLVTATPGAARTHQHAEARPIGSLSTSARLAARSASCAPVVHRGQGDEQPEGCRWSPQMQRCGDRAAPLVGYCACSHCPPSATSSVVRTAPGGEDLVTPPLRPVPLVHQAGDHRHRGLGSVGLDHHVADPLLDEPGSGDGLPNCTRPFA